MVFRVLVLCAGWGPSITEWEGGCVRSHDVYGGGCRVCVDIIYVLCFILMFIYPQFYPCAFVSYGLPLGEVFARVVGGVKGVEPLDMELKFFVRDALVGICFYFNVDDRVVLHCIG